MGFLIVFLKDWNVILTVAVAGIIYAVVLLLLKFFHKQDWELVRAAVDFRKKIAVEEEIPEVKI